MVGCFRKFLPYFSPVGVLLVKPSKNRPRPWCISSRFSLPRVPPPYPTQPKPGFVGGKYHRLQKKVPWKKRRRCARSFSRGFLHIPPKTKWQWKKMLREEDDISEIEMLTFLRWLFYGGGGQIFAMRQVLKDVFLCEDFWDGIFHSPIMQCADSRWIYLVFP